MAAEIFGSFPSARATRTFSRAAPSAMPHFQLSQCAQDCVAPSDQDQETMVGGVDVTGERADLDGEFVGGWHTRPCVRLFMRTVCASTGGTAREFLSS
jgi:hypothetical protein